MSGFAFDARAALERARETRPDPILPNPPNRAQPLNAGIGRIGGLGRVHLPPLKSDPLQTVLTGDPDQNANAILADLRLCISDGEIEATLARYRDAIEALAMSAPVRKIHLDNLVDYKLTASGWGEPMQPTQSEGPTE